MLEAEALDQAIAENSKEWKELDNKTKKLANWLMGQALRENRNLDPKQTAAIIKRKLLET